jgi:hypothetical protein
MPVHGQEPIEEDLEWLKFGRDMIKESPKVLDEAAKSFLALGSSLLTVYTGALAIFKLNERASGPYSWAIIFIPIVLWLSSISCLAYVYFPDRCNFHTNSPSEIERVTQDISKKKSFRLKIGSILFVAALAATSLSVVWLGAQPSAENEKVGKSIHLVVAEENDNQLKNLSGSMDAATFGDHPVLLLSSVNLTFLTCRWRC